jgi:hypothetical protein
VGKIVDELLASFDKNQTVWIEDINQAILSEISVKKTKSEIVEFNKLLKFQLHELQLKLFCGKIHTFNELPVSEIKFGELQDKVEQRSSQDSEDGYVRPQSKLIRFESRP